MRFRWAGSVGKHVPQEEVRPKIARRADAAELTRQQSLWLLIAASATCLPLLSRLPLWLGALASLMLVWRGILWWRRDDLPPRGWLILLTLGSAAGVVATYHNLFGREPGVALLVLFLALKLLEAQRRRDGYAAIFLGYFLQVALFFDTQNPAAAAAAMGTLVVATTALILLNHDGQAWQTAMRRATLLLAQSVPFMLVLFVLFPRIQGPLWGMPMDAYKGMSGLSDSMAPGTISQLSLSSAIAFRAKFEGSIPPQDRLYWRGPVLTRFDGRTWRANVARISDGVPYTVTGPAADYAVTLEPHDKTWLFALDLPGIVPTGAVATDDFQIHNRVPVRNRTRYAMRSYTALTAGREERPGVLLAARQLPADTNPRARALATDWTRENPVPEAVAARALALFRQQPFVYTLSPPLLADNPVDRFLFDTRRGFCEHYAAAFVFLMRAAGVPARVVTGYQGGEANPVDGYLVVRQSDAHAWAEIWVEGQGWLRIDPTAAVSPLRIERGLASAVPADDPVPGVLRVDADWLRALRFRWEAAANAWDQWVLGYNPQRQRELLKRLGMNDANWKSLSVALSASGAVLMLALVGWALWQHQPSDPLQRQWARLSRKLGRRGLHRQSWEGPLDYAHRVAVAKPHVAHDVTLIAKLYAGLRYGASAPPQLIRELARRISRLRP
jgi:protein-glutamine gamma-glutamyltransferase